MCTSVTGNNNNNQDDPGYVSVEVNNDPNTALVPESSAPPEPPAPAPPPPKQGAQIGPLCICVIFGFAIWAFVPKPKELTPKAWQLLAIFLSTIAGLILGPLPGGAWAFVCLTVSVITRTLTFAQAFNAFTNQVIWLIVISFFFARGFVKTGLGDRIATYFVKWLGKSTLGLSYGLVISEAVIAPAMPSTTARAGGVFVPIIKSLSLSAGSNPDEATKKKLGCYLMMSQFQAAGNSSALWMTAAAQNMFAMKLAEDVGVKIPNLWVTWLKVSCLPALVGMLLTPLILYKLYPPELKDTPEAPEMARRKLERMGPLSRNEIIMICVMVFAVSLWVFGELLGIPSVVSAMLGLSMLLLTGVLSWKDCLSEQSAWDTLSWFAVLVGMAAQLSNLGIIAWLANNVSKVIKAANMGWITAFASLQAAYYFIHYLLASQTGHVAALYSAFLAMHIQAGVPGVIAALALAYNTNLFGAITHYASGTAAAYYGAGYVTFPDILKIGFAMTVVNAIIWATCGALWWKILGYF